MVCPRAHATTRWKTITWAWQGNIEWLFHHYHLWSGPSVRILVGQSGPVRKLGIQFESTGYLCPPLFQFFSLVTHGVNLGSCEMASHRLFWHCFPVFLLILKILVYFFWNTIMTTESMCSYHFTRKNDTRHYCVWTCAPTVNYALKSKVPITLRL